MSKISFDGVDAGVLPKVTEVELIYRNKVKQDERPSIRFSDDAYKLLLKSWDENKIELQEQFKLMLLDRRNKVIGISMIATGGMTECLVDLKIAFAIALKTKATNLILAHNHPSGNITPSENDKRLTERFTAVAKIHDISVLDHIVLTKEGYTSFADEGFLNRNQYSLTRV